MKKEKSRMIFAAEEDSYQPDIPIAQRELNTIPYDYSVQFLVSMIEKQKIIIEVPFQRKFIWGTERKSQFIESIIMNVPIPPLYFAEEKDGEWLVIDGLQRLCTIKSFYKNEFSLKKLEIIRELEGKKYEDFQPKIKNILNDGLLRVNVIKNTSHPDIKYDIFMRLNRGAVVLNYQELRNCLYRGNLNNRIKQLVEENVEFLQILKLREPHDRFLDVEFILRYLSLSENLKHTEGGYILENYTGRMVNYINDFMKLKKDISTEEANNYAIKFNTTIQKVISVFGVDKAFRDISTNLTKVSKPLADVIMLSFEQIPIENLRDRNNHIISALTHLLKRDREFKMSISLRTSDKDVIHNRINIWFSKLKDVVAF